MRPELINRLDKILVFRPLSFDNIKQVVEIQLNEIRDRMISRGVDITWDKKSVHALATKSHSPEQGARLVRKTLQDLVENSIAQRMLKNPRIFNNKGSTKAKIKTSKNEILIEFDHLEKNKRAN